ncbi:hypothetical protein [Burkholderia sp. BE17]|uniref:hypothetical protein n=1 Tax=Burkholderia sp. BE17 TaxID=2656644 RepID=UPI00128B0619|nr:hypothetical protein [Burkholderia sp. BE17]MPV71165.1 hypothetical protein [Burkholderia sp. BE17]
MSASARMTALRGGQADSLDEHGCHADAAGGTLGMILAGLGAFVHDAACDRDIDPEAARSRIEWFRRSVHALIAQYASRHYALAVSAYDVGFSAGLHGLEAAATQMYRWCYDTHVATDPQGAMDASSLTDHLIEAGFMHGRGIRAWMVEK